MANLLITNSLVDTQAPPSLPFVSDESFKGGGATAVRPLPRLSPLVFFLYKETLQVRIRQRQPAAVPLRPTHLQPESVGFLPDE